MSAKKALSVRWRTVKWDCFVGNALVSISEVSWAPGFILEDLTLMKGVLKNWKAVEKRLRKAARAIVENKKLNWQPSVQTAKGRAGSWELEVLSVYSDDMTGVDTWLWDVFISPKTGVNEGSVYRKGEAKSLAEARAKAEQVLSQELGRPVKGVVVE